ncbi:2-hydroxy-6-oxo-2,4-heptadienoate hydrolase [Eucalyptus grandis]|uniref:2-hydroxy-6-oxo-2,4-heptadienoate hydrolase n=1 Tax=Eucalyptus grandis TaxID=71139 RepID=UPI00192EAB11|nr:2-hydroxy-6-oxo-2,4-heptadienoate hydrolase [Eucalyptus grandis]
MSGRCFSLTEFRNRCYRSAFARWGLRSALTDLRDGTVVHCWVPKARSPAKPDLLLIHGLGANALWQWADVLPHLAPHFNLFVPDLLFFGDSFTSRPDRSDSFQARCLMRVMEAHSVRRLSLVGLSYGGFVAYSMAAQSMEEGAAVAVERVVICCAAVCIEEREIKEGMLSVSDLEQAAGILVPQTPARLRELMSYTLSRHPPLGLIPSCLLSDFIDAMCADYIEQKRDLVRDIPRNRKVSEIPKITQPTLIIWGEHDHIFPVELGHRLKRHIGDNAHLVVIKDTGHAFNMEKPKEFHKLLKMFLVDRQPPPASSSPDYESEKCTTEERTSDNGSDPKTKATASTNAPSQA